MRPDNRITYLGCLVAVLLGSFFLTLALLGPASDPIGMGTDVERLASRGVTDYSDLGRKANAVGLKLSRRMNGSIDTVRRINDRDVTIAGWLADPEGDATPLKVAVFVAGAVVATTQTQGERPDVTRAMGLSFGAEKNVAFRVVFNCLNGQQPVVVGLGSERQYFPLRLHPCS